MKSIYVRLSEDLHFKLKTKAIKEKISVQKLIENFVKDYVRESESKKN